MLFLILLIISYSLLGYWGILVGIILSLLLSSIQDGKKDRNIFIYITIGIISIVSILIYLNQDSSPDNTISTGGYRWAESNGVSDFSDCDYKFGAGTEAEDGCNSYVQENLYYEKPSFGNYECTEDCGGHEAGYEWAERKDISDVDDCGGNSDSFIEGCWNYVEDNY